MKNEVRVLVCGPEASGTKFLHRIVSTGVPADHRSWPYGHLTPDMREDPNWTHCVVILRDWSVTIRSQVRAGHSRTPDIACGKVRAATANLINQAVSTFGENWWLVSYESLIHEPERVVGALEDFLGVALYVPEDVVNGNLAYG